MDEAFVQLEIVCEQSLANLPDFGPSSSTLNKLDYHSLNNEHDTAANINDSFCLSAWRQLIEETAKGIEFCGGYLFASRTRSTTANGDESTTLLTRLQKLTQHAAYLASLINLLPADQVGYHYCQSVREAAGSCLKALMRLPSLYRETNYLLSPPAVFLWNQTIRLRDIPESPVTFLLMRWEKWLCHLREAREEVRLIVKEAGADSEWPPHDRSLLKQCELLIRFVKSLMRKIRINYFGEYLNKEVLDQCQVEQMDKLLHFGGSLAVLCDELVAHLGQPLSPWLVIPLVGRVVREAEELLMAAEGPLTLEMDTGNSKWTQVNIKLLNSQFVQIQRFFPLR